MNKTMTVTFILISKNTGFDILIEHLREKQISIMIDIHHH